MFLLSSKHARASLTFAAPGTSRAFLSARSGKAWYDSVTIGPGFFVPGPYNLYLIVITRARRREHLLRHDEFGELFGSMCSLALALSTIRSAMTVHCGPTRLPRRDIKFKSQSVQSCLVRLCEQNRQESHQMEPRPEADQWTANRSLNDFAGEFIWVDTLSVIPSQFSSKCSTLSNYNFLPRD